MANNFVNSSFSRIVFGGKLIPETVHSQNDNRNANYKKWTQRKQVN